MNAENRRKPEFTQEEVNAIVQTEEARKLLQMLQKNGGSKLTQATDALRQGDLKQIAPLLKPLLDNPDAEILLQKISQKLGRS